MRVLFSHNDLDGVGSLILNEFFGITFDQIHILAYDDIEDENGDFILPNSVKISKNDDVVVTDLSMKDNFYKWIKENSKSYLVFDHHDETSKHTDDPNITYSKTVCGTKLYFEYLTNGKRVLSKLKELVELINTYDNYNDESPLWEEAQNLNRVFYKVYSWGLKPTLAVQRFIRIQIGKLKSAQYVKFEYTDYEHNLIQEVIEKEQQQFEKSLKSMKLRKDNAGNLFGVIIIPTKVSITCYNLLKEVPDLKYIIAINSYKGINGKVSVRAQKKSDINVNCLKDIAGHEKAGGGTFSVDFLEKFYEDDKAFFEYNPEFLI